MRNAQQAMLLRTADVALCWYTVGIIERPLHYSLDQIMS